MTCELHGLADVLGCTHAATEWATARGFSQHETWELSIAFSELAANVVRHGGGGAMHLEWVTSPGVGVLMTAEDDGPGIDDVEAAFVDDFSEGRILSANVAPSHRKGLGSGLGAVQRLTDDVSIGSRHDGGGTAIRAFKQLKVPVAGADRVAGAQLAAPGATSVTAAAAPAAATAPAPAAAPAAATPTLARKTPWLILGLGNTILRDDGVGIKVARYIAELGHDTDVVVKEAELAGFALIDMLEGFEHAIVIDAVRVASGTPGDVVVFESGFLQPSLHLVAGHQIDMPTALEMGRQMGRPMPGTVYIVGIHVEDDCTFDEECTPAVAAAIPTAAHVALRLVAAGSN